MGDLGIRINCVTEKLPGNSDTTDSHELSKHSFWVMKQLPINSLLKTIFSLQLSTDRELHNTLPISISKRAKHTCISQIRRHHTLSVSKTESASFKIFTKQLSQRHKLCKSFRSKNYGCMISNGSVSG